MPESIEKVFQDASDLVTSLQKKPIDLVRGNRELKAENAKLREALARYHEVMPTLESGNLLGKPA